MPFTSIPPRTTSDLNAAADVNTLMENSTFNKSSRNHYDGLILSNSPGDTEHDITISTGICKDDTYAYTLELSSALTKRIDAAWSAGNNGGFLDTGSVAANTQYAVWIIRKDSDGTADAIASTSFIAPTMPSGYTYKKLRRGFTTDSSSNIINNKWLITDTVNDRPAEIILQHQETQNTAGGTFSSGSWVTTVLNTLVLNEIPGASLATNQITLPAGTYYFNYSIICQFINTANFRLYNVTGAVQLNYGMSIYNNASAGVCSTIASDHGYFSLTTASAIALQGYCTNTRSTDGFGTASNITTEVYSNLQIIKTS